MPDLDLKPDEFVSVPDTPMVRRKDFWIAMAVFVPWLIGSVWLVALAGAPWWTGLLPIPPALWIGTIVAGRFPSRMFRHLELVKKRSDR